MKDIENIQTQLSKLRKSRYELYMENRDIKDNPYAKYACCKNKETLAIAMKLDRRTIGKWESGQAIPTIENLIELSKILNCSVEYFLGTGNDSAIIASIEEAAHYSQISPAIIKYGLEHPDYLDCLNFFMLPKNCSSLFNKITLCAWKKYWITSELSEIKSPLKERIMEVFNEFNAVTPFDKNNKNSYKNFLRSKFPSNSLYIGKSIRKNAVGFNIKLSLPLKKYKGLLTPENTINYDEFINYLADYTYDKLIQNSILEAQKVNLAKTFINLFTKYLSDIE